MQLVKAEVLGVSKTVYEPQKSSIEVLSPYISNRVVAEKIGLTNPRRLWNFKRLAALFIPEKYQRLLDPETGGIRKTKNQLCEEDISVMFRIRYLVNTYGESETPSLMSNEKVKDLILDSELEDINFAKQIKEIYDCGNY